MFRLLRQLLLTIGSLLLLSLGISVCVGWYTHTEALLQIHPSFVPMQFNTALGFTLLGLSLFSLVAKGRGRNCVVCAPDLPCPN